MITDTRTRILGYIRTHKQARAHDLGKIFDISQVAVHKQLKALLERGEIKKIGKSPLVFYVPATKKEDIPGDVRNT